MIQISMESPIAPERMARFRARAESAGIGRDRCLVAVSGGPDSMGLLGLLQFEFHLDPKQLVVCYVDHGLRSTTKSDISVIHKFTEKHGITFRVSSVSVPDFMRRHHASLESAARTLRYQALSQVAEQEGCKSILTGHTMDDSAETVLMRMQSGSPWYEWTGIPAQRGNIHRPLIDLYRSEVLAYIQFMGISYVEDETNQDLRIRRNLLRSKLEGSDYWSKSQIEKLALAGEKLHHYLHELRSLALGLTNYRSKQAFTECRGLAIKLILTYFNKISFLPVESAWAELIGEPNRRLSSAHRRQISDCIHGSTNFAEIDLPEDIVMQRRGDLIWIFAHQPSLKSRQVREGVTIIDELNRKLELSYQSHREHLEGESVFLNGRFISSSLSVRTWQPGDRIKPHGRPTKKISDLLAEKKLNPLERASAAVLCDESGPLALLGKCIDERALPSPDCRQYLKVSWIPLHGK
jgi:tRNA(Ile)-lysidine synthase